MASSKFENIWNILSNHNLQFEGNIPDEIKCSICSKLMRDPYVAMCGCPFCAKCIQDYLIDGRKLCNGKGTECNVEYLEMDKNVLQDYRTRLTIGHVTAKCPYSPCSVIVELTKIQEHMDTCSLVPKKCPYRTMGCLDDIACGTSIEDHLIFNALTHTQLLVEVNSKLRTDIDFLKKYINELKEESHKDKLEIDNAKEESQRRELIMNEEVRAIMSNLEEIKTSLTEEMKTRIEIMKHDFNLERSNQYSTKEQWQLSETRIKTNEEKIGFAKNNISRINSFILKTKISHDFLWTINDFTTKIGWLDSEVFCKDDYNLSLGACIGSKYLYLYFHTTKGDRDSELDWPMTHRVTLALINQLTMTVHKRETYKYNDEEVNGGANTLKPFHRPHPSNFPEKPTFSDNIQPSNNASSLTGSLFTAAQPFGSLLRNTSQGPSLTHLQQHSGIYTNFYATEAKKKKLSRPLFSDPVCPPNAPFEFTPATMPPHQIINAPCTFGQAKSNSTVTQGDGSNIWCLWISIKDIKSIPGLLLDDCLMVCCFVD